jgi:hypothetical protein
MCLGCYAEYRFPKIISPATTRAVELVEKVYEFSCVGGNLHCELDDWNIDDEFFEADDLKVWHGDASAAQIEAEKECFHAFKAMTLDERASALALRDSYLRPDGTLDPEIDEAAWLAQVDEEEAEESSTAGQ